MGRGRIDTFSNRKRCPSSSSGELTERRIRGWNLSLSRKEGGGEGGEGGEGGISWRDFSSVMSLVIWECTENRRRVEGGGDYWKFEEKLVWVRLELLIYTNNKQQ